LITSKEKKLLKAKAHSLTPVVQVGKSGLSNELIAEVNRALEDHELIKVKVSGSDRDEIAETIRSIGDQCQAELVQTIGKIAVLFRESTDK
jgi:RNA-binding protein